MEKKYGENYITGDHHQFVIPKTKSIGFAGRRELE